MLPHNSKSNNNVKLHRDSTWKMQTTTRICKLTFRYSQNHRGEKEGATQIQTRIKQTRRVDETSRKERRAGQGRAEHT